MACCGLIVAATTALAGSGSASGFTTFAAPFTGASTLIANLPASNSTGAGPQGLLEYGSSLYTVDSDTGTLYRFGLTGGDASQASHVVSSRDELTGGLAESDGVFYAGSTGQEITEGVYRFNPATLALGPEVAAIQNVNEIAVDPNTGDLYVTASGDGLYRIQDPSSDVHQVTEVAVGDFAGLGFTSDGQHLWVADDRAGDPSVDEFNVSDLQNASSAGDCSPSATTDCATPAAEASMPTSNPQQLPVGIAVYPIGSTLEGSDVSGDLIITTAQGNSDAPGEVMLMDPGDEDSFSVVASGDSATRGDAAIIDPQGNVDVSQSTSVVQLAPAAAPQTYVVGGSGPSGVSTLDEAVSDAAASGDADVLIQLPDRGGNDTDYPVSGLRIDPPPGDTWTIQGEGNSAEEADIEQSTSSAVPDLIIGSTSGRSGQVNLDDVMVSGADNSSDTGGAIEVEPGASLDLDDGFIDGNSTAGDGGGILDDGALTVENSTISDNGADGGYGGGIAYGDGAAGEIVNSTIVNNFANTEGGGIAGSTTGPTLASDPGVDVLNSTIADNSGGSAGGIYGYAVANVVGTIIDEATYYDEPNCNTVRSGISGGYNIADDASCGLNASTDKQSTDPQLNTSGGGELALSDSGPTPVVYPLQSSPARSVQRLDCPAADQRGASRTANTGPCDIGAAEPGSAPPVIGCPPTQDAYAASVLSNSPMVYYPLNESTGLFACDVTDDNIGTYASSGVGYGVPGPLLSDSGETAISGDGTDSNGTLDGGSIPLTGNASFTLEGWFQDATPINETVATLDGGSVAGMAVWSTHSTCGVGSNNNGSALALDEHGLSNCWDTTASNINLFDGSWHYLVISFDGTTNTLTGYVDGVDLGAEAANNNGFSWSTPDLQLGYWVDHSVNQPFTGNMAQVAVYPTALSAADVSANFAAAGYTGGTTTTGTTTTGTTTTGTTTTGTTTTGTTTTGTTTTGTTTTGTTTGTTTTGTTTTPPPPPATPDLSISVSQTQSFTAGSSSAYEVQVDNRGTGSSSGSITVTATLPAGISYQSATGSWSCVQGGAVQTVTCTYSGSAIAAGQGVSLELKVAVAANASSGTASFTVSDSGDSDKGDKTATSPTTIVPAASVAASFSGPGTIAAGMPSSYTLKVENLGTVPVAAGASVNFTIAQQGVAQLELGPVASGNGWSCATLTTGASALVHCTAAQALAGGASAPVGLSFDPPLSASGSTATLSYAVLSAVGARLASDQPQTLSVAEPKPAALSATIEGPSTLKPSATSFLVTVDNTGGGPTTGPTVVKLGAPAGIAIGQVGSAGWSCTHAASELICTDSAPIGAGKTAPSLVVPLTGTAGARTPDSVALIALSTDSQGAIVAHAAITVSQPVSGSSAPSIKIQTLGSTTSSTAYSITVSNTGDGDSGTAPLSLTEILPAGVRATANGPGWTCTQTSTALSCKYSPVSGVVLGSGGTTPPLHVSITGVSSFSGESIPITTTSVLTSSDGVGHSVSIPSSLSVEAKPAPASLQATISTALDSTSPGSVVATTFGVQTGASADPTSGIVAIALVLPQGVGAPSSIYWHDGVLISPDDQIPPSGSTAPPVPVQGSNGQPAMTCQGYGSYVVCAAPDIAPSSEINVEHVPITFSSNVAGSQTLTAGIVPVTATTVSAALSAASTAVAANNVSALQSPQTAVVNVPVFAADAGTNQRLAAVSGSCVHSTPTTSGSGATLFGSGHEQLYVGTSTSASSTSGTPTGCTLNPTLTPTTVNLDGSGTVGDGKPLTYKWVQTSGPAVTWSAAAAGQTPGQGGSTLPAFPSAQFTLKTIGTASYGPHVSFTYPGAGALTSPTQFGFTLEVTDGSQLKTASTTVELDPPPPAPPVTPKLCLWDYTQTRFLLPTNCLSSTSPAPKAGDVIVAGAYSPFLYDTDAAGDALSYVWSVTDPSSGGFLWGSGWHLTPANGASAPGICQTSAAIAGTGPAYCFEWPSGVSVLGLSATITNFKKDAQGDEEKAVAGVTFGSTPPPVTVSVPAPDTPAAAGSSVSLTAAAGGATAGATYTWIQTAGPVVSGLPTTTSSSTLKFTAPAPSACATTSSTGCGQAVSLQVLVTEGSGAGASTGQGSVMVPLAPAPALAVSVTGPRESASGQVPLSAPGTVTLTASATGAGSGASYKWTIVSGSGSVASSTGPSDTYTSTAAGLASVSVTVTQGSDSATTTIPIVATASSSGSSTNGVCTGLLGSIINQVFPAGASLPSGTAVLSAGPVTLDLPTPTLSGSGTVGSSGIGCTLPTGDTLSFSGATATVGPLTLSDLSASVSLTQITLSSGTVTAPSSWGIGQGTISQAIEIPLDGTSAPTGAVTWTQSGSSSGLPVLPAGSGVTGATTTVKLGAPALTLTASASVLGGTVHGSATIPLLSSSSQPPCPPNSTTPSTPGSWCIAFSTTTDLQVLGTSVSGSGTFTYGANGFSGAFTATAGSTSQPIEVGPVNVTSATLTWDSSGISLSASAWALGTASSPVINLSFAGTYEDGSNWSATVTGAVKNNPRGLPNGVNLVNAAVTGSVVDQGGGGPIFDVKLSDPGTASQPALAISAGSAAKLSFTNLAVEISNGSPPAAACQDVNLPASAGDTWVTLGGTASVTLGSAAPVSVSATACLDPTSGSFGLSATGFDNWSPGGGVTFTSLNLTVSYTGGAFQAVASGGLTVDGVQAQGAVAFTSDGNVIAIGALPNLSQLGLPLGDTAGVAVFSSDDIPDLGSPSSDSAADQAVLPEMFCGLSEGTWSGSACTGAQLPSLSEGKFAGVDANGLTLAASFSWPSSDTGLLNRALGLTTPQDEITPDITVSVDLGAAVPTITGTLSAPGGGFTVLHVGPNTSKFPVQLGPLNPANELPGSAFTLNLQSLDIQIALDGSLSVGAQATVTMPSPTPSGASTNPSAPQPTSCADPGNKPINSSDDCEQLGLAAAITLDADGPTLTLAGTVDGCDAPGSSSLLCNALGVQGLDVGDLSVQLGLDFSTTPIPTPTFGFAAAIQTIPCNWASTIGYSEQGCNGSSGTPTVGLSPAMSIAVNLSDTGPIFAFQIGAPNSTTPTLRFGNALTVDEAGVVIAPAGGTIGAGPDAVTYQPGFSLSFNGAIMGVPLLVKASVDPTAGTISACAHVGTISVGGLTVSNASFDFALGASTTNQCSGSSQLSSTQVNPAGASGVGMVLGFTGSLSAGPVHATVALSMQATSGQYPMISLYAGVVGTVELLDNTVDLNSLVLSGSVEFNPQPPSGTPPFSFTVQGSASMSVLGNSINVAGSVALTSDGIQNFSLYANPSNAQFTLGGADLASLTGNGCAPQQLPNSIPANIRNSNSGACVGVSYDPSAATSFQVTLDATAQVAGIGVTFDGTASNTGLNITYAAANLPGIGSVQMTGQIWLGAGTLGAAGDDGNGTSTSGTGNLAGTQWYDRNSGQWVNVQPGDFEFSLATQTPISFDGVKLDTTLQFGSLGSDVFADGAAGLSLPGGGWVDLTGRFCASDGNFGFMLGASLDLNALDSYNLASGSATLTDGASCLGQFSGPTGLTFQVSFTPPPLTDPFGNTLVSLSANASGSVTENPDGSFQYGLQGNASIDLYGVTLSGGFNWSNSTGSSVANLPFSVSQAFGSAISFSGSAAVAPDGSVCGVQGSATITGITGTASFCDSGGTPDIEVNFMDGDLAIGGSVDGPTWTLTASDSGSLSLDVSNSFLGITYAVDSSATWDISAILTVTGDNVSLATPTVSGSGNLNASISIPALPTASSSASFSLSGTPADICGSAAMSASFIVTENVGSVEVCDNNGTVEVENLSWFGQTLPTPPFPSFPWTA